VLYSLNRLSPEEKDLAQSAVDNVSSFVCGATQLFDEGHQLASKLFVRSANACGLPVEKQYYTSKQFRDCCTWCGLTDPLELEDLESLNLNGAKGYSICKRCYADGKKVITFGKATKTADHKSKAKGRKRAKKGVKGVVDSSEEEEDKSAEGELRACSFCKSGIYHDNANCLGEQRVSEASLTYKSFPWCCPKCFQRGKVALEKTLLGRPSQTNKRGR
jgi:hypothetical protein